MPGSSQYTSDPGIRSARVFYWGIHILLIGTGFLNLLGFLEQCPFAGRGKVIFPLLLCLKRLLRLNFYFPILLILLSFSSFSRSHASEVLIIDGFESIRLAPFVDYYESLSQKDTVNSVQKITESNWVPVGDKPLSFGLSTSDYWFRFRIEDQSGSELLLDAGNTRFDRLQMYLLIVSSSGHETLMQPAPTLSDSLFPINIPSGFKATILLRAQDQGSFYLPLRLWEKNAYYQRFAEQQLQKGLVFGFWIAILIFNLALLTLFHHRLLLTFNGLILFLGIYHLGPMGWFNLNVIDDLAVISLGLGLLCLCSFVDRLLNLKQIHEIGHRVLQTFTGIIALGTLSYLFLSFNGITTLLSALSIPVSFTVLLLGIIHMMQKNKVAIYALLSLSILLMGIIVSSLDKLGFITTNSFTNNFDLVGFLVMCISMSFVITMILIRQDTNSRLSKGIRVFDGSRTKELETALEKLSQDNDTLREYNTIDSLTGIKNRRYFDLTYEQEFRRSIRGGYSLSLILIDVDHFKSINDRYGHLVGDECLRKVTSGIGSVIKRPGDILARYGGEEFAIVLPYVSNENALHLAREIHRQIKAMILDVDGEKIQVTISIGVSTVKPSEKDLPNDLISSADSALYKAKNNGRDQVQSAEDMVKSGSQIAS